MKTNKIIAIGLATTAIIALSMTSASAMYGQGGEGQGQGGGSSSFGKTLTTEQRAEIQAMSDSERQAYIQELRAEEGFTSGSEAKQSGHDHDMGDMIVDIPSSPVDAVEIDLLQKQYEEEMMANELYALFYELYGVETFNNISNSEAQHMEAVKTLLDRYDIEVPTSYDHIQDLYDSLKAKGELSLKDALEVGVSIEIVDIDDIVTAIKSSDNDDIRTVLVNIGGGSYNHMRGFVKALANNGFTTDIDYSDYYDEDNSTGNIKVRLAEKLEADGVVLPEGATSAAIKEKCDNEEAGQGGERQGGERQGGGQYSGTEKGSQSEMSRGQRGIQMSNSTGFVNSNVASMQARYKSSVETKYGAQLDALGDVKLEALVGKIDDLIVKINTGDYAQATKEKYTAILLALMEVTFDRIDVLDSEISELFN